MKQPTLASICGVDCSTDGDTFTGSCSRSTAIVLSFTEYDTRPKIISRGIPSDDVYAALNRGHSYAGRRATIDPWNIGRDNELVHSSRLISPLEPPARCPGSIPSLSHHTTDTRIWPRGALDSG